MIYLDHASTSPLKPGVAQAQAEAPWANSHSTHSLGLQAQRIVMDTEALLREHIGVTEGQFIWTGSGSLANRILLAYIEKKYSYKKVWCSVIEHKSIIEEFPFYNYLEVDSQGHFKFFDLFKNTREHILIAMMVNNELGTINSSQLVTDLPSLAIDCVQALGKVRINLNQPNIQLASFSAHKIGGPKGLGCLWVKDKNYEPSYQGTVNVPAIAGFKKALEQIDTEQFLEKTSSLRSTFLNTLARETFRNNNLSDWRLNIEGDILPSILSIRFPRANSVDIQMLLDSKKIFVSTSSACNSNQIGPSHVLKSIGLNDKEALSTLRFSFDESNTADEIIHAAKIVAWAYNEAQALM